MSKPTFERFNYSLRPSKNVERKMICDVLSRLNPIEPLHRYQYVGFGSLSFVDFSLFHRRLGIRKMISIEERENSKRRIEFNRPFAAIETMWGKSSEVLPLLALNTRRSIVWLDYECYLNHEVLSDIQLVSSQLRSGSVLLVTVLAQTDSSLKNASNRLDVLKSRVGKTRVPIDIQNRDLSGWGLASVSRRILETEIRSSLIGRNAGKGGVSKLSYRQLFNFRYADGTRMLTTGGIISNQRDSDRLTRHCWEGLPFLREAKDAYEIKAPVLTWRETVHLDQLLRERRSLSNAANWIPKQHCDQYKEIYRYAPTYLEAEL